MFIVVVSQRHIQGFLAAWEIAVDFFRALQNKEAENPDVKRAKH